MSIQPQHHSAQHVLTLASMETPSLNESDTDDSFMKRIIMHNRSQSEDVLRPQAFSRAQVRPRNNRLTLANLERLPIPEPPQVTTKSDLGSIESRSSSERSRNKLEAIRRRELEIAEEDEDEERRREQEAKEEARRKQALEDARVRLREQGRIHDRKPSPSHQRDVEVKERIQERSQERSRSRAKRDEPTNREREASGKGPDLTRDKTEGTKDTPLSGPQEDKPNSHARSLDLLPQRESVSERDAGARPTPEIEHTPAVATTTRADTEAQQQRPDRRPSRQAVEVEEGSDLMHIRNMGNHLKSLSANLEDVRTGMDNISKMTGKPPNGSVGGEVLTHMSDREVFEAVSRAMWASLWVVRHDSSSWKGFRLGPGFWLLLLLAVPVYVMLECISCMLWCRPAFADSMDGMGTYPDAPELPFVIPTLLLRPLRPALRPMIQVLSPIVHWLYDFVAYVAASGKEYGI